MTEPSRAIPHHQSYYLADTGMVKIQVENVLFHVHKYFLIRESAIFRDMFEVASTPSSEDDEIVPLPEVTCTEFEAFLDFLYNGMFLSRNPLYKPPSLSSNSKCKHKKRSSAQAEPPTGVDQRVPNLLAISLRFACDNIVQEISMAVDAKYLAINPSHQLIFALKHDALKRWIKPALYILISRMEPLSAEDIRILGPERAQLVAQRRESRLISMEGDFRRGVPFDEISAESIESSWMVNDLPKSFYIVKSESRQLRKI